MKYRAKRVASICYCIFFTAFFILPDFAFTEPLTIKGHAKYRIDFGHYRSDDLNTQLGPKNPIDESLDLRLNIGKKTDNFDFITQGEVLSNFGDTFKTKNKIDRFFPIYSQEQIGLEDRTRFFDLSKTVINESGGESLYRFDRLSVGYSTDSWIGRVGRQAISWGNGLAFHVMDFFNPFSPTAIDKDYKTGDDLVYQQVLFPNGNDLQFVFVPRRDIDSHDWESNDSSYAAKYRGNVEDLELDYDLISARHYNDNLFGVGISHNILDAVWRADFLLSSLEDGSNIESFVTNLDRSWLIWNYNVYTFIEYFHNGFGVSSRDSLLTNVNVANRIARGELFTISKNAIALGLRVEIEPRLNTFFTDIHDAPDSSGYFQIKNEFEIFSDFLFTFGVNLPYGARNTEFGGLPLAELPVYVAPSKQMFFKVAYYF